MSHTLQGTGARRRFGCEHILLLVFLLSLPLMNPWVRGDGVGYYSYVRALLIDHNLRFEKDYRAANPSFRDSHVAESGEVRQQFYTPTGRLDNHFSVGPAILWSPFLLLAHSGVLMARGLGSTVAADGYSTPYRLAMALATAFYGFLGLWLSFRVAREYVAERWALLGTLGVWWASSFPVYAYFNPSWSHAHSAFACALFIWYWHRTREGRTLAQWLLLGLSAGLMINVYYLNAAFLLVPGIEGFGGYLRSWRGSPVASTPARQLALRHALFIAAIGVALLPTWVTRLMIYGHPFESGYIPLREWGWTRPALWDVLFSSDHGLLSWTPILLFALAGMVLLWKKKPRVGGPLVASALAFYYVVAAYPNWDGLSSYGNRFFVSLTPLFVLGLAMTLESFGRLFARERAALACASVILALFIAWNLGFMFQWGMHLIPVRGPISWSEMARNQFQQVPRRVGVRFRDYLFHRGALMQTIEERDLKQLKANPADAQ
ncbi:MAG: hypothetical protein ABSF92_13100 [Candidatus Acidiferrales bacterium]|jgi:hypothetical protein